MITELVSAFRQLTQSIDTLTGHLLDEQPLAHVRLTDNEAATDPSPLAWACDLISDLSYQGQQDGRTTRTRHGLINATPATQALIADVNKRKQAFTLLARALREHSNEAWQDACNELNGHPMRTMLTHSGLTRLHLKQCTRSLLLSTERPLSCRFSWYANGKSIVRISHATAQEKLLALGEHKDHIQAQLHVLGNLRPDTHLAQVQTLAPTVRANLVLPTGRRALNCPLPLFIPAQQANEPLPIIKDIELSPPEGRTRKSRADGRLSESPILPSLRVFSIRSD
ncbi:MAG: DNA replication terminus site-binding protein [Pseudomonadota bacterium]|nr:DNA replication terminus site-binding protein [Pseudomonadota bacterium]